MNAAPTAVSAAGKPPKQNRQVLISKLNTSRGKTIVIPVTLKALGNESALGFTLNFNAACLQFVSASTPISGASLILNDTQVGSGHLALLVGLPLPQAFPAGSNIVVNLTFHVPATVPLGATALTFSNDLTGCAVVDAAAADLKTTFTNGTVNIRRH